jgi:hypothetical protein
MYSVDLSGRYYPLHLAERPPDLAGLYDAKTTGMVAGPSGTVWCTARVRERSPIFTIIKLPW